MGTTVAGLVLDSGRRARALGSVQHRRLPCLPVDGWASRRSPSTTPRSRRSSTAGSSRPSRPSAIRPQRHHPLTGLGTPRRHVDDWVYRLSGRGLRHLHGRALQRVGLGPEISPSSTTSPTHRRPDELVRRAVRAGGRDNVSVLVVVDCRGEESEADVGEGTAPRGSIGRPGAGRSGAVAEVGDLLPGMTDVARWPTGPRRQVVGVTDPSRRATRAPDGWTHTRWAGRLILIGLEEDVTMSARVRCGRRATCDDVIDVLTLGGPRGRSTSSASCGGRRPGVVAFGPDVSQADRWRTARVPRSGPRTPGSGPTSSSNSPSADVELRVLEVEEARGMTATSLPRRWSAAPGGVTDPLGER